MPIFWRIVTFLLYSVRIILCLNQIKKEKEMDQMPACPKCKGEYVYHDSVNFVCPDCGIVGEYQVFVAYTVLSLFFIPIFSVFR